MTIRNDLMIQLTSFKSSLLNNEPMAVQPLIILLNVLLDVVENTPEKKLIESIQKTQNEVDSLNRIIGGKNVIIPKTEYLQ